MIRQRILCLALLAVIATPAAADDAANREAIRAQIENIRELGIVTVGGIEVATGGALAEFYERRDFAPTWSDPEKIGQLLELVKSSADDGLNTADYHIDLIERAYAFVQRGESPTPRQVAVAELLFSDALLRFGFHQILGRVDPNDLDARWNFESRAIGPDPIDTLQRAIDSPSLSEFVDARLERGPLYLGLRDALKTHRRIADEGGWPQIPAGDTLRPAMSDPRVATLAERLAITGDLDAIVDAGDTYTEAIAGGVRAFQDRHGLEPDGIIGPATLAALNVPVEERIDQLRINLERARWVMGGIDDDFIVVNIAGFRAYLVNGKETVWDTRVQVGAPYHQSPVFRDEMTYVVMNPTWTVPYSIATREMLPRIQRDPDYFRTRTFDVRNRDGQNVDPDSIDWSSLSRGNFPYTFVQRPGPANALGRIKFIFPNEYAVYLHDTPSKSLFGRAERAFSHGCIRTENPFDLAERLLGPAGWDRARIDAQIASEETKTVHLAEPLQVLLLYWTAEIGPDGKTRFYKDVYERDQRILTALNEPFERRLPL